jgi:hypothetical protein
LLLGERARSTLSEQEPEEYGTPYSKTQYKKDSCLVGRITEGCHNDEREVEHIADLLTAKDEGRAEATLFYLDRLILAP